MENATDASYAAGYVPVCCSERLAELLKADIDCKQLGPVYISWALSNNASATSRGVAAGLIPGIGQSRSKDLCHNADRMLQR